ncbi:SMP-30/gluconolactonase/LRE family protein [Paludibacterium yongneupense]|uniref:SMP-30/gluconolactonase/LRE family protein n=1 Tax=Paludibacterium yongneupense TaxID=400061 RepID=UPI000408985C|nr:SMP-30/gluconolactonase/LRE family protein [Paludibacterium yongneupense]
MPNFAGINTSRYTLGECAIWDERGQYLWWTDILARRLLRFDPATGDGREWPMPQRLGCFALTQQEGLLLLGLEKGLARFDYHSGELTHLCAIEPERPGTRINDGRCDRAGNFVFGTLNEAGESAIGSWYRYSRDGVLLRLDLPACRIPNSLCFSLDGATLYFADSASKRIMCCDYDAGNGATRHIRLFHDLAASEPAGAPDPDGSIIDAAGGLWNAQWGAGRVARYFPDGRLDQRFDVGAAQPSCPTFGGSGLDTMYLTTALTGLGDAVGPADGAVLAWQDSPYRGVAESRFG